MKEAGNRMKVVIHLSVEFRSNYMQKNQQNRCYRSS